MFINIELPPNGKVNYLDGIGDICYYSVCFFEGNLRYCRVPEPRVSELERTKLIENWMWVKSMALAAIA
jgi:hypothetical protein